MSGPLAFRWKLVFFVSERIFFLLQKRKKETEKNWTRVKMSNPIFLTRDGVTTTNHNCKSAIQAQTILFATLKC